MWLMVFGIVATCQPWSQLLHVYGITLTLVGLVGFSIFSKFQPLSEDD
jgi:preprotein translocase subunit Sss1